MKLGRLNHIGVATPSLAASIAPVSQRHPELVSGSIMPQTQSTPVEGWMLKQVQHDAAFEGN